MFYRSTDNLIVQDSAADPLGAPVWSATAEDPKVFPSLCHVVQFYAATPAHDFVQSLTARSMLIAQELGETPVRLLAAPLAGEEQTTPQGFTATPSIRRTSQDLNVFKVPRKLPLLFDILDTAAAAADLNGFLIFTNSDICVQPHFYDEIHRLLAAGFDCLIINRRTVGELKTYGPRPDLAQTEVGEKHPGADCFVFPVAWVARFIRADACIGTNYVMRSLVYNLIALADRMLVMKDAHLTYHYGNDETWKSTAYDDYSQHNLACAGQIVQTLCRTKQTYQRIRAFCIAQVEPFVPYAKMHETGAP